MTPTDPDQAVRLSRRAVVVVRPGRLTIPIPGDLDELASVSGLSLHPAGLALIGALAANVDATAGALVEAVARTYETDAAPLHQLVEDLAANGLLLEAGAADGAAADTPWPRAAGPRDGADLGEDELLFPTPRVLLPGPRGFALLDHAGETTAELTAPQAFLLRILAKPTALPKLLRGQRMALRSQALERDEVHELVRTLVGAGAVRRVTSADTVESDTEVQARINTIARQRLAEGVAREVARVEADAAARAERLGRPLVRVLPVSFMEDHIPLALGLIYAYAKAYDGGRLQDVYEFRPEWVADPERLAPLLDRPAVVLFSNYVWSHGRCLDVSARVKAVSPDSVTIHGGPDTPKYPADVEEYFRRNPHVDVTVHGEGEATAAAALDALGPSMAAGCPDLSALADVPGLSYRDGDRVVRTEDRDRIADLDSIPSPYLTGEFDAYADVPGMTGTFESNRGCPYGCTFCDWGSATLSRIRKFDLARVLDELTWMAERHFISFGNADANFGIYKRDVEIAQHAVAMKAQHGFPLVFGANYAKNTVKYLRPIIELLSDGGILSYGVLSLQTMDEGTLDVVRRTNIKLERYDELAVAMQEAGLPLFVDLMLGLPGQTLDAFRRDLQECADREVQTRIAPTELLVNSPMNDPDYRAEHGIRLGGSPVKGGSDDTHAFVVESASFTRRDRTEMMRLRQLFLLSEDFGVLRQICRYARAETGIGEIDLLDQLAAAAEEDPERWPWLWVSLELLPRFMAAPGSWRLLLGDVRRYLVDELGVADDDALDTAIDVQHALLPDHSRRFPDEVGLAHDYGAWWRDVAAAKAAGHLHDWPDHVRALRTYGPSTFRVDDPGLAATRALGGRFHAYGMGLNWEMDSPVARSFLVGEERAQGIRNLPELLGL